MIDRSKIRDRVDFLRQNLDVLRDIACLPRADFTERSPEFHAAVRLLQISVEAMIDVGTHIVAREGLGSPKSYIEVFEVLARAGVIPVEFLDRARSMVRFRNRAVHVYRQIDVGYVYDILQEDLGDFETFIRLISQRYLA